MPSGSADVPQYTPLDVGSVQNAASTADAQNIANSIALENQYAPGLAAATTGYQNNLAGNLAQLPQLQTNLANQIPTLTGNITSYTPPTLTLPTLGANPVGSAVSAVTAQDLQKPGQLMPSVAAATGQNAPPGQVGSILGPNGANPGAAGNLGLTSQQLINQNIGQGNTVGQLQQALNTQEQSAATQIQQANAALKQANMAQQANTAGTLNNLLSPYLSAMTATGNTPLPTSGLSGSDVASLYTAQNNAQNQNAANDAALQQQATNNQDSFYGGIIDSLLQGSGSAAAQNPTLGGYGTAPQSSTSFTSNLDTTPAPSAYQSVGNPSATPASYFA